MGCVTVRGVRLGGWGGVVLVGGLGGLGRAGFGLGWEGFCLGLGVRQHSLNAKRTARDDNVTTPNHTERQQTERHEKTRHDTTHHDTVVNGTVRKRHDKKWHDAERQCHDTTRHDTARQ